MYELGSEITCDKQTKYCAVHAIGNSEATENERSELHLTLEHNERLRLITSPL